MLRPGSAVVSLLVSHSILHGGSAAPPAVRNLKLPLAFARQTGPSGERYIARGNGYALSIDSAKTSIDIVSKPDQAGSVISMEFAGGRRVAATAGAELPGKVNYIYGNDPSKWKLGLPTYESVGYQGVYPGVDVVYYGNQRQLEFDLVLKPGVDPRSIRMKFGGTRHISIDASGQLVLEAPTGEIRLPLPQIYQGAGESKKIVAGQYKLRSQHEVAFEVATYDRAKPLVIDPAIVYSALLGNADTDVVAIALDSSGNAYVAGNTESDAVLSTDFPVTPGAPQSAIVGLVTGFVSKINSTGTGLIYSTYLGGSGIFNSLVGIAVDSTGSAWVAGLTSSTNYPLMSPTQGAFGGGGGDAVIAKLSSTGALLFSTYLGGSGTDEGTAIAVDANNNAYITGYTSGPFPTTPGVLQTASQGTDAFVAKFNSSGSLVYSTLVGGAGTDQANGVAADLTGAYITGSTTSTSFTGAPAGGARTVYAGGEDAFVAKLKPTGTALLYFTFLGGSSVDFGTAITVDGTGNAYIGGNTFSSDLNPTPGVLQSSFGGGEDGFIAKLNNSGSAFSYVTYLGGERSDTITGIALEPSSGNLYVAGDSSSAQFPQVSPLETFPPNVTLFQTTNSGGTWSAFDTNLPGGAIEISADPTTPGVLIAANNFGIYRTTNNGTTWTLQQAGFGAGYLSRSPANPNTIYALLSGIAAFLGLPGAPGYVSLDGGITWSPIASGAAGVLLVADPLTSTTVYSYANGAGITKSVNGGQAWVAANSGLPSPGVQGLAAAADGTLYALVNGSGVYKSTNQAVSWTNASTGLPASIAFANNGYNTEISVSPGPSPAIYVVSNGVIYKSTMRGAAGMRPRPSRTAPLR